MINIIVGSVVLATGTLSVLTGLALAVAEIITGAKGGDKAIATQMAGLDWTGLAAVLNGLAALAKALAEWRLSALLVFLGLVADGMAIWLFAARPL